MNLYALCAAVGGFGVAATSQAAVFFTFDDPGAGAEIQYTAGTDNDTDPGQIQWVGGNVELVVDGSDQGLGEQTFNAAVNMSLQVGAIEQNMNNLLIAPVLGGSFEFVTTGEGAGPQQTILTADLTSGALLTLNSTGAIIASSTDNGGLTYTAGEALEPFLGELFLAPIFDASFTLTNISPPTSENEDGFITDFFANSAFTGNAEAVPTPGAVTLLAMSALMLFGRRGRIVASRIESAAA